VKLGKNASDNCVMLSEIYVGVGMKKSSVLGWHKWFTDSSHAKKEMKVMLITFFDIKDTVHFEFISQGQTVN
jgi:hypothetical protein